MNILLIGSGGREHALAWKIARSPSCETLFIAPGNPGTAQYGETIALDPADHQAVIAFCRSKAVALVVIGPEIPLVAGLVDDLTQADIRAFGPSREAAKLEGSKGFTKDLCAKHGIPTAAYGRFKNRDDAKAFIESQGVPIVVKADGLAAGKGVVVALSVAEANEAVDLMLADGLRETEIVIEEFLAGEEASFFALCDGKQAVPFGTAQDHKRAHDGDRGPNTGGMGAYSPAPVLTAALERQVMDEIVMPTIEAMRERGTPFKGILYAGLMLTPDGPKLIEYNTRFGDPECQVLMPRLESDLVEAMLKACEGRLDSLEVSWREDVALTVVMAARGYPGPVETGTQIRGIARAEALPDVIVFQAGTKRDGSRLLAQGGRVLGITASAPTITEARSRAYAALDLIDWPEGFCRRDIGWRAVEREQNR